MKLTIISYFNIIAFLSRWRYWWFDFHIGNMITKLFGDFSFNSSCLDEKPVFNGLTSCEFWQPFQFIDISSELRFKKKLGWRKRFSIEIRFTSSIDLGMLNAGWTDFSTSLFDGKTNDWYQCVLLAVLLLRSLVQSEVTIEKWGFLRYCNRVTCKFSKIRRKALWDTGIICHLVEW